MGPRAGFFALLLGGACAQLQVKVEPRVAARLGSQALLPCMFSVGGGPVSTEFLAVSWYFQDKELASFDQSLSTAREGASMDTAQLVKGNASLTLRNVAVQDQGTYQCVVIHTPERAAQSLELAVLATPSVAVSRAVVLLGEQNLLKCTVSSFYPANITVNWLRAGLVLPSPPLSKPQSSPDGTFSVSSSLPFQPSEQDRGVPFSCQVQHASLPHGPLQTDFQLVFGASPVVQVRAPTFVQGKAQVLTCDVRGFYPEAIAVNWLVDGVRTGGPQLGLDDTFSLESFYQFEPMAGSEGTEISCEVQHETLSQPLVRSVRVQLESEGIQVSVGVLVVVLLSVLVVAGLMCCVVWAVKESLWPFLASEVMGPKVWVAGESVALVCVAHKSPAGTWVRWSRCQNGEETVLGGDEPAGCHGKAQPLMAPQALYTVQEVPLPSRGLATVLTFQARIPEDEGAGYRCSFISKDGKTLGTQEFTGFTLHPPRTQC